MDDTNFRYDGPQDPAALLERFGIKVLSKSSNGQIVTFAETQALIDEYV